MQPKNGQLTNSQGAGRFPPILGLPSTASCCCGNQMHESLTLLGNLQRVLTHTTNSSNIVGLSGFHVAAELIPLLSFCTMSTLLSYWNLFPCSLVHPPPLPLFLSPGMIRTVALTGCGTSCGFSRCLVATPKVSFREQLTMAYYQPWCTP